MQLPEGEFLKGFVQDILKQLRAGNSSFPQQIIKMGMQGRHYANNALTEYNLGVGRPVFRLAMDSAVPTAAQCANPHCACTLQASIAC